MRNWNLLYFTRCIAHTGNSISYDGKVKRDHCVHLSRPRTVICGKIAASHSCDNPKGNVYALILRGSREWKAESFEHQICIALCNAHLQINTQTHTRTSKNTSWTKVPFLKRSKNKKGIVWRIPQEWPSRHWNRRGVCVCVPLRSRKSLSTWIIRLERGNKQIYENTRLK